MTLMLSIGKLGAQAFQTKIDVGANNIANSTTNGYKRNEVSFQDLMYQNAKLPVMNGNEVEFVQGSGVRAEFVGVDFSQGTLLLDQNEYCMAILGEGYFGVLDEQTGQMLLTRDGSFGVNADGNLVDVAGREVMGEWQTNGDGNRIFQPILYRPNLTANMTQLNQNNYYAAPENLVSSNDAPEGFGTVQHGALESSNVDLATEMTNLIVAQRAYNMNLKSIQTADETWQIINQLR